MFNTYSSNHKFNFDVNAVSGTIRKSHPKSIICKVSEDTCLLFMDKPMAERSVYNHLTESYEVVVLQVLIIKDGFIVEFINMKYWEEELSQGGTNK